MFSYDAENNILTVKQTEDYPLEFNILKDQLDSYQEYLTKGVYEDMNFLLENLRVKLNHPNLIAKFRVGELYRSNYRSEIKRQPNMYYPVYATFEESGLELPEAMVFRIPYMDTECKVNVNGQRKIVLMEQRASNDLSYDARKKKLVLQSVKISNTFQINKSSITVKTRAGETHLDEVVRAALFREGKDPILGNYITNSILKENMVDSQYYSDAAQAAKIEQTGIFERFASDGCKLGFARESLNSLLQIDDCLSHILARPVLNYPAGTLITQEILKDLKRNRVNLVFIKEMPYINGHYLAETFIFNDIPKGTPNCEILRQYIPQEADNAIISKDYNLDIEHCIAFLDGAKITTDMLECLMSLGIAGVKCKSSSASAVKYYGFEREIIGNYTFRLSDLTDNIPAGRNPNEWIYCYDNDTLENKVDMDYINAYDLLALYSLLGRIALTGECNILNKDTSFLKKVNLVGDTFSEYFRRVVPGFVIKCRRKLGLYFAGRAQGAVFFGIYSEWRKQLIKGRVLASADTVNVVAEIAQACHVETILKDSNSTDEMMHRLAIPYFGRLCPYETPAGKKLGLVNTKAIGARVINGLLCVPYRRVIHEGDKCYLEDKITYLSVKEDQDFRIGDITQLVFEPDKKHFKDTRVIAIVPNPDPQGEKVTFANTTAHLLDYVTCHAEQHLSPTACLMPFAGNNDANRISFGLNMIRQAIYTMKSDIPRVTTFMYKDIYKYPNAFIIRAEKSGVVTEIDKNVMYVMYDGDVDETEILVQETRITNESVIFMNYRKNVDERFQAGDVLVDSTVSRNGFFAPARNELVAYVATAYNHEDGVHIAENTRYDYVSLKSKSVEKTVKDTTSRAKKMENVNRFRYVKPGDTVMSIQLSDRGDEYSNVTKDVKSSDAEGLVYNVELENEPKSTTYRANILSFNTLGCGDKMAGRHGNKGVVTHVTPTSKVFQLANGMTIKVLLNPHGVPSRMNLGQIKEAHCGLTATVLDTYINSDPFNGASLEDLKYLMNYSYTVANTPGIEKSKTLFDNVVRAFDELPKEFHEHTWSVIDKVVEWRDTFDTNGDARLWDPETNTWLEYPVTIGVVYFEKLMQEAEEKEHSRAGALEEPYSVVSKQPPKGSRKMGGQKMGEMELVDYASYGAMASLHEICNEESDNVGERANIHLKQLGYTERVPEKYCNPRSYEILSYLLEVCGSKLDTSEEDELNDLDNDYASNGYYIDVKNRVYKDKNETFVDREVAHEDTVISLMDALDKAMQEKFNE